MRSRYGRLRDIAYGTWQMSTGTAAIPNWNFVLISDDCWQTRLVLETLRLMRLRKKNSKNSAFDAYARTFRNLDFVFFYLGTFYGACSLFSLFSTAKLKKKKKNNALVFVCFFITVHVWRVNSIDFPPIKRLLRIIGRREMINRMWQSWRLTSLMGVIFLKQDKRRPILEVSFE